MSHQQLRFYVLCFTRPRYQVSGYRTIGPLVTINEYGSHLGHVTCTIYINFPTSQGGSTQNFALIGQAVSEKMFENTGHIRGMIQK